MVRLSRKIVIPIIFLQIILLPLVISGCGGGGERESVSQEQELRQQEQEQEQEQQEQPITSQVGTAFPDAIVAQQDSVCQEVGSAIVAYIQLEDNDRQRMTVTASTASIDLGVLAEGSYSVQIEIDCLRVSLAEVVLASVQQTLTVTESGGDLEVAIAEYLLADDDGDGTNNIDELIAGSVDNSAPVIEEVGAITVREGTQQFIDLSASDAEGDDIVFSAIDLPEFVTLSDTMDGEAELRVMPGFEAAGDYSFTISVTDEIDVTEVTINLTVEDRVKLVVGGAAYCTIDDGEIFCSLITEKTNVDEDNSFSVLGNWRDVSISEGMTVCALANSMIECWDASEGVTENQPELINPVEIGVLSAGSVCVLDDNGVICWGKRMLDVPDDFWGAKSLVVGADYACALLEETVRCWGAIILVSDTLINPSALYGGPFYVCVVHDNGKIACWGDEHSVDFDEIDEPLAGLMDQINPQQIAIGSAHACALIDGEVLCWGLNDDFQSDPPRTLINPVAIGVGDFSSCAVDDTGVVCWGRYY